MRPNRLVTAVLAALVVFTSAADVPARAQQNPVSVAPLPPVSNPDGRFGVVQGIQAPDLAWNAGARIDRVIFPWSLIQKNGPDSWDEQYFSDHAIRAQANRGVTIAGVMIYTPQWASIDPPRGRPVDKPQGLYLPYNDPKNYWGQFVRKLVDRHKGVVDHWIVWNEPDLYDMAIRYTWDGSFEDYFQLLKVAYLNVKEVNPKAKVILGGMAYWWDKEHGRPPFIGPLFEVIGRDPDRQRNNHYFDIVSVHVYSAPLNSYAVPLVMKEIMDLRHISKPIWIFESNAVPYGDPQNPVPYSGLAATLDQQASYVIQSMALALAAGVERYSIYKLIDETPENGSDLYGLVRNDRSLKPAYVAYQVGASYFSNAKSAVYSWPGSAEIPTAAEVTKVIASNQNRTQFIWPAQISQVVMERGRNRTTVAWNNSPEATTYKVPASARRATLVTKYGKSDSISAEDGFYVVDLPGSTHNPDRRDYSIYMIGGEPIIIDEEVAPLPDDRVASRIEIVWPENGGQLHEAEKANITAQLLMPGSDGESVPCRYTPQTVQLWAKRNGGEKELVGAGERRITEEGGIRYPVWDFSGVSVKFVRDEAARVEAARREAGRAERTGPAASATTRPGSSSATARPSPTPAATPTPVPTQRNFIEFFVEVDGVRTDADGWIYGGPNNEDWRGGRVRPRASCQ